MSVSKYDDKAVIKKLTQAFARGASIKIACGYAGITDRIYYEWQNRAESGDEKYVHVFQTIKGAAAQGDMKCLERIDKAVDEGIWQAAAWKLERRHPDEYGNNAGVRDLNHKMDKLLKDKDDEAKEKTDAQP